MQTSLLNTITSAFKPWTDLAKEHTTTQLEHAKNAGAALTKGINQESLTAFAQHTSQSALAGLQATAKAVRLVASQTENAVNAQMAKSTLPGADLAKKVQAQMVAAHEQVAGAVDKLAETLTAAKPERKATRAA